VLYLDESHTLQKKKKKKKKNNNKKKENSGRFKTVHKCKKKSDCFLWTVKNRLEYNVAK
jgi:chlorite dismutase